MGHAICYAVPVAGRSLAMLASVAPAFFTRASGLATCGSVRSIRAVAGKPAAGAGRPWS